MAKERRFPTFLREFGEISVETREQVVAEIEGMGPAVSIEAFAAPIAEKTGVEKDLIIGLLEGFANIVGIVTRDTSARSDLTKILAQVAAGVEDDAAVDPVLTDQMSRLLGCSVSIGLTAKAQNIMWGHGQVFRDVHTVSQIRPLFLPDLNEGVEFAVIIHELQLDFQSNGKSESICLTMDADKIIQLRNALDRALKKDQSLQAGGAFQYLTARR